MIKMIDIKVKDQYSQILDAKAVLSARVVAEHTESDANVFQQIDHIFVNGEMIQPSIELLYESQNSSSIYKVVEV